MKVNDSMKSRAFDHMGISQQKDFHTQDAHSFKDSIRAERRYDKYQHQTPKAHETIDDISKETSKINDYLRKILDLLSAILEQQQGSNFSEIKNTHNNVDRIHPRQVNSKDADKTDTDHSHSEFHDHKSNNVKADPNKEKSVSQNKGKTSHSHDNEPPFSGTVWDVSAIPDNAPSKTINVKAVDKNSDGASDIESVNFYDGNQKEYVTEKLHAYDVAISDGTGKERTVRIHLARMQDMSENQRFEIAKNYGNILGRMPAQFLSGEGKETDKIVIVAGEPGGSGGSGGSGGKQGIVLPTDIAQDKLDDLMLHQLAHAWNASKNWFSDQEQWQNAMKEDGGPAISKHAEKTSHQDFSETLAVYLSWKNGLLENSSSLTERYKNRFQVLESLGF